ncbi:MAG: hypothetical protein IJ496_04440, partial [Ruminococcus sp.]|nr:hypothetical protein [Ruminococcus sp.]
MADITTELSTIRENRYGAEIRNAIADAIEKLSVLLGEDAAASAVQEVIDARTSSLSGTEFSSLSQRLTVDFNACITQGELENACANTLDQARDTGVGRFWRDENGVAHGEIFGDYANNIASAAGSSASGYNTQATGSYASTDGAH